MLLLGFAIYDSCSGVYDRPWFARSEAEAVRGFSGLAQNADHIIGQHPEHFKLYRIGTFDDNTGQFDGVAPVHVANAHELVASSREVFKGNGGDIDHVPSSESSSGPISYGGTD